MTDRKLICHACYTDFIHGNVVPARHGWCFQVLSEVLAQMMYDYETKERAP